MAEGPGGAGAQPHADGSFVSGSILRHVLVMSAAGSVGLMAVFVVDLLSLLYVSKLGDPALTAAVGFASIVQFFAIAINIGLMIAAGAVVSRALGAGDTMGARRLSASAALLGLAAAALLVAALLPLSDTLLRLIGASGEALRVADRFVWIALPSNLFMAPGMLFSGILRAAGEARRAMWVTLGGAVVTVGLDPLLIFGAGLGVDGAAITTCVARATFLAVGWHGVRRLGLIGRPSLAALAGDAPVLIRIAVPAVLTNLAPPVASAFLAHLLARYGAAAVAGNAVIDRLTPVAFGGLFALSGAIGPILGQNWGAGRFDRMRLVLREGVRVTLAYTLLVWLALALGRAALAGLFELTGVAAELFTFFCLVSGPIWLFNGLLFLSNAAFNNLGFPIRSTLLNWGRATLGTVPPALLGAALYGPRGVVAGAGIGSLLFGSLGLVLAFRAVGRLEREATHPAAERVRAAAEAGAGLETAPARSGALV